SVQPTDTGGSNCTSKRILLPYPEILHSHFEASETPGV
ncbi:unnamed protein product, partial [Allacma fusca]